MNKSLSPTKAELTLSDNRHDARKLADLAFAYSWPTTRISFPEDTFSLELNHSSRLYIDEEKKEGILKESDREVFRGNLIEKSAVDGFTKIVLVSNGLKATFIIAQ